MLSQHWMRCVHSLCHIMDIKSTIVYLQYLSECLVCVYTYICVYVCVCVCVCAYVCAYVCVSACVSVCVRACVCLCLCVGASVHVYVIMIYDM